MHPALDDMTASLQSAATRLEQGTDESDRSNKFGKHRMHGRSAEFRKHSSAEALSLQACRHCSVWNKLKRGSVSNLSPDRL